LWRELGLIYRRDRHLPRAASAFVELIRGAEGKSDGKPESKDGKPETKNGKADTPPNS
jgi:hypothetical protein